MDMLQLSFDALMQQLNSGTPTATTTASPSAFPTTTASPSADPTASPSTPAPTPKDLTNLVTGIGLSLGALMVAGFCCLYHRQAPSAPIARDVEEEGRRRRMHAAELSQPRRIDGGDGALSLRRNSSAIDLLERSHLAAVGIHPADLEMHRRAMTQAKTGGPHGGVPALARTRTQMGPFRQIPSRRHPSRAKGPHSVQRVSAANRADAPDYLVQALGSANDDEAWAHHDFSGAQSQMAFLDEDHHPHRSGKELWQIARARIAAMHALGGPHAFAPSMSMAQQGLGRRADAGETDLERAVFRLRASALQATEHAEQHRKKRKKHKRHAHNHPIHHPRRHKKGGHHHHRNHHHHEADDSPHLLLTRSRDTIDVLAAGAGAERDSHAVNASAGGSSTWIVKHDKTSGRDYYVNTINGKRTWIKPPVLKMGAAPRRASSVRKGPSQRQAQQQPRRRSSVSLGHLQAAPGENVDAEFEALKALALQRKSQQRRSTAALPVVDDDGYVEVDFD